MLYYHFLVKLIIPLSSQMATKQNRVRASTNIPECAAHQVTVTRSRILREHYGNSILPNEYCFFPSAPWRWTQRTLWTFRPSAFSRTDSTDLRCPLPHRYLCLLKFMTRRRRPEDAEKLQLVMMESKERMWKF